jgi:hypothetical protein
VEEAALVGFLDRQAVAVVAAVAEPDLEVVALARRDKAPLVVTEPLQQVATILAQAAVVAQAKQEQQAKLVLAAKAAMVCWCQ